MASNLPEVTPPLPPPPKPSSASGSQASQFDSSAQTSQIKLTTKSKLSYEFVESLTSRLHSLLPNRTSHSLAEVELDPQFLITKKLIFNNSKISIRDDSSPSSILSKNASLNKSDPNLISAQLVVDDADANPSTQQDDKQGGDSSSEDDEVENAEFITNVFVSFSKLLDELNTVDNYSVQDHDEKSLSSILLMLRLLSDLIKHIWNKQKKVMRTVPISDHNQASQSESDSNDNNFSDSTSTSSSTLSNNDNFDAINFNRSISGTLKYSVTKAPAQLEPTKIEHILDVLITLLSAQATRKALSSIKRTPVEKYHISDVTSTNNTTGSSLNVSSSASTNADTITLDFKTAAGHHHEAQPTSQSVNPNTATGQADFHSLSSDDLNFYIDEIDDNLEIIFKYISNANPIHYYEYINTRIMSFAKLGEIIPTSVLQKYSPLFKWVFYTPFVANALITDIYNALPFIKSNSWKQTVLLFFTQGLRDHWYMRPEDYETFFNPYTKLEVTARNLFDYVCTIFEDSPHSGCSAQVQSLLLMLCIGDFVELDQKPNKLRIAFNKRLKFVNTILRDANACANLECFDSLINLFHLSSLSPPELHHHPVYQFALAHLDETYENLNKMVICFNTEEASIYYDKLVVNFYVSAILMKPHVYSEVLYNKFQESKDNIKEVRTLIKVIRGLSESPRTYKPFLHIMKSLAPHLKSMVFGAFKILDHYEQSIKGSSNDPFSLSSSLSVHSDKYSVDSDQKPRNINQIVSKKTSLDHYINEITSPNKLYEPHHMSGSHQHLTSDDLSKTATKLTTASTVTGSESLAQQTMGSSNSSTISSKQRLAIQTEEIMGDIFAIFTTCPDLYFHDTEFLSSLDFENDREETLRRLTVVASELSVPLKFAFSAKNSNEGSNLFEGACALTLTLVESDTMFEHQHSRDVQQDSITQHEYSVYCNFLISNYIVEAVSDASLSFSLTDPKFKSCFLFLTRFLQSRGSFLGKVYENRIIQSEASHADCIDVCFAMEKILVLVLCTHDIQFYTIAKSTMKMHIQELESGNHLPSCFFENLGDTFQKIVDDNSVFTGFVSLHKRVRNILREAKPTKSLYHVWIVIYFRWLEILENKSGVGDDSLIFRHFTGFLVSTAGAFIQEDFLKNDPDQKYRARCFVSDFFDKAISLLTSSDLVVRVVVKDAISNESHSAVFHLVVTKLIQVGNEYLENKIINDESIMFIEQAIVIITAMSWVNCDGAFVLVSLLPGVCEFFIRFINMVPGVVDTLRLKLRFCKLGSAIETEKNRVGLSGAFKLRNFYAKCSADWLEQAVFYDEMTHGKDKEKDSDTDSVISPSSSSIKSSRDSEIAYLNIDLASDCAKCLASQLKDIVLEIPDGTKDKDIRKYKDLAFGNYFSLFYKILQKYAGSTLPSTLQKSKYKIQMITDDVLECISNILQFDTDIGMQFVLPLGYHENKKIRSIFLNVFANMLKSRKTKEESEEFPDNIVESLSNLHDIYGATAEVASSAEHNLLASSLFAIFSYTRKLDRLFKVLLKDEINMVARSTDIFRRNSTLTRLLSNFAKDYGLDYLSITLKPFLEEVMANEVSFEVEKNNDPAESDLFMTYYKKLVDVIINSIDAVPPSFEFICREIYHSVKLKFEDAALVAVGSFIFLRFFCPAIISPETFFSIGSSNFKVKRSLMQLVKVIQNMANGSLALLKWPGLIHRSDELNELNRKIFDFLEKVSTKPRNETNSYPFQSIDVKPIPELRYFHKFLYTYFIYIKHQYILTDPLVSVRDIHERVANYRALDKLLRVMGQPKALISLQISNSFRNFDPNGSVNHGPFNEFMSRMASKNIELPIDTPILHNAIFHDGNPVVVINFGNLKTIGYDVELLVFKLLETCCQIWDNTYYMVFDFTGFTYIDKYAQKYVQLLDQYAPAYLHKHCRKIYYFNIPRVEYIGILKSMRKLRIERNENPPKVYTYSQVDSPEIINNLCLDESTLAISRDTRVVFKNVKLYDEASGKFQRVTIKIGRQWLQICADFVEFGGSLFATRGFYPVEVLKLSDITKCEMSSRSGETDEFTIHLNLADHKVILKSSERPEILRFLYFTTSRLPKSSVADKYKDPDEEADISYHWFARLHNIAFHGLLDTDIEVRSSASFLFATLSQYYDFDFGISPEHAKNVSFPVNTTDYLVGVSSYLSKKLQPLTYRFLKAFFNNFDKLQPQHRLSGIMYISPWVGNICDHVYLDDDESGIEKVSEIVRQFCRITVNNAEEAPCINDLIWKTLFRESRFTKLLLEEVIAFAIDNKKSGPEWSSILAVIYPSVDVCAEVVSRLVSCIGDAKLQDSAIASQSKLLEIMILVKICSSVFFNSYVFAYLYLSDVFFVCTLFIDNPALNFGSDLQNFVVNSIQSFIHKPDITPEQEKAVEETISYFSSQRAKMLFGVNRERSASADSSQTFNRAESFEILCDYLNTFIDSLGSADDRFRWRSKWCSRAVDVAFKSNSVFQSRAILVFGILSKSGISDSATARMLRMLGRQETFTIDYITNTSVAVARIFSGLSPQSCFPRMMILPQICYTLLNFASLYQPSIHCLVSSYSKVVESGPDYIDKIIGYRAMFEPLLSKFESAHNFQLTSENLELFIFFGLVRGFKSAHFKQTSLICLKKVFAIRYKHRSEGEFETTPSDNISMIYLLFIYLNSSESAFEDYLNEIKFTSVKYKNTRKSKFPKIFTDFILSDSDLSQIALIRAAYFFNLNGVDSSFKKKFLSFYTHLFKKSKESSFLIYHVMKPAFEDILVTSNSVDIVNNIADISTLIFCDENYSPERFIAREDQLLNTYHCLRSRSAETFEVPVNFVEAYGLDALLLKDMINIAACSFVEGYQLED